MSPVNPERVKALLCARSGAVVGTSDRPGSFGKRLLDNLAAVGYPGEAYPINPRLDGRRGRSLASTRKAGDCGLRIPGILRPRTPDRRTLT